MSLLHYLDKLWPLLSECECVHVAESSHLVNNTW